MGAIFMKFIQLLDECLHQTNVLENVETHPLNTNNFIILSPKKKNKKFKIDTPDFKSDES